ncbi:MAG TPA: HAD family phosphatase [Acidobacteriaceae bacterium]|nr:HAD family phosphatase [Acidobacteriaceae bacterium]
MPIRGVIFDYGMVLSQAADPDAHARMVEKSGLSVEEFNRHYWKNRHSYDLGMKGPAYWAKVASDAGTTFSPEQVEVLIENDVLMWTSVNEEMLAWVVALQNAGFRTAILSNMVWEILGYLRQEFGWLAYFQQHTWSCELGIGKPDPAIYLHTCKELDVMPQEALFLDDKPENIAAAEKIGLQGIQFSTVAQLRRDLVARGLQQGLPVPGESVETPA